MKRPTPKATLCAAILLLPLHANALDFDAFKQTIKETALQEQQTDAKDPGLTPTSAIETVAQHDYEGALTNADRTCTQMVDNFELDKDIGRLFVDTASSSFKSIRDNYLSGKKGVDKDEALKQLRQNAKKLNWLPMSQELILGEEAHTNISASSSFITRSNNSRVTRQYEKSDALLKRVASGIEADHPYDFKLFLLNDRTPNAMAGPGGYLYLSVGALDSDHAELILSHEIAHVLKRHKTREIQATLIDSVDSINALKKLMQADGSSTEQIKKLGKTFVNFNNYSKNQELQSDACAVRIATNVKGVKIGPQIAALTRTFQNKPDQQIAQQGEFGASHPPYKERRKTMKDVAGLVAAGK